MRVDGSFPGTLHEASELCEPVAEDAEKEKATGQKAEPPRRRSAEMARAAAASAAAQRLHDSPELALPQVDVFDWPGALLHMVANDAGDGNVDETSTRDPGSTRRDDVRFEGAPLRLDADAGTPSPPFGARLPGDFPGIPTYDFVGDGAGLDDGRGGFPGSPVGGGFPGSPVGGGGDDGEFTIEHARLMRGIVEGTLPDEARADNTHARRRLFGATVSQNKGRFPSGCRRKGRIISVFWGHFLLGGHFFAWAS
jgi:hypothetical protein